MAQEDHATRGHMAAAAPRGQPRRMLFSLRQRRRLQTVRLGGKKPRRGRLLMKMWRKMRLRWLKLQYTCMLKKLKEYYKKLIADMVEAGASVEAYQQRLLLETTCAVPTMSFCNFPSVARPRAMIV